MTAVALTTSNSQGLVVQLMTWAAQVAEVIKTVTAASNNERLKSIRHSFVSKARAGALTVLTWESQDPWSVELMSAKAASVAQKAWWMEVAAAAVILLTLLGVAVGYLYPGRVTGAILPVSLALWWLLYKVSVRQSR